MCQPAAVSPRRRMCSTTCADKCPVGAPRIPPVASEADLILQVYNGVQFGSYRTTVSTSTHKRNVKIAHSATVNSNLEAGYCGPVLSELCLVRGLQSGRLGHRIVCSSWQVVRLCRQVRGSIRIRSQGDVAPNSSESFETFLSSNGPLYDEGIYLAGLRLGFEFVWLGGFLGRAGGRLCVR
jgi:hypothetical protein